MDKLRYLAETETFIYYRNNHNEVWVFKRLKGGEEEFWANEPINKRKLIKDCLEANIIKLSPIFVEEYVDITNENNGLIVELV